MRVFGTRKRKVATVTVGGRSVGLNTNSATGPDYVWLRAEARRRGIPMSQVLRDCCKAYRALIKDAAARPEDKRRIEVDFSGV